MGAFRGQAFGAKAFRAFVSRGRGYENESFWPEILKETRGEEYSYMGGVTEELIVGKEKDEGFGFKF